MDHEQEQQLIAEVKRYVTEHLPLSKMSDEEATELFSKYTFQEIWCIWGEFDWAFSGLYGGGWIVGDKDISLVLDYYSQRVESVTVRSILT